MDKATRIEADVFYRLTPGEWTEAKEVHETVNWYEFHEICAALASLTSRGMLEQSGETDDEATLKYRRAKASEEFKSMTVASLKNASEKVFGRNDDHIDMNELATALLGF